jgi:hypothetical protein
VTWRVVTEWFILINVVLSVLYTVLARIFGGPEATVSAVMQEYGERWPFLVGITFAIVAHWHWPVK